MYLHSVCFCGILSDLSVLFAQSLLRWVERGLTYEHSPSYDNFGAGVLPRPSCNKPHLLYILTGVYIAYRYLLRISQSAICF